MNKLPLFFAFNHFPHSFHPGLNGRKGIERAFVLLPLNGRGWFFPFREAPRIGGKGGFHWQSWASMPHAGPPNDLVQRSRPVFLDAFFRGGEPASLEVFSLTNDFIEDGSAGNRNIQRGDFAVHGKFCGSFDQFRTPLLIPFFLNLRPTQGPFSWC